MTSSREAALETLVARWTPMDRTLAFLEARIPPEQRKPELEKILTLVKDAQTEFRALLREDLEARAWLRFLMRLPCESRWDAFMTLRDRMSDADYWSALRYVWMAGGGREQFAGQIRNVFLADRAESENLMDAEEHAALARLPEQFEVYRGAHRRVNERGWSWTLEESTARRFLLRGPPNRRTTPVLLRGRVPRLAVVAHFLGRDEAEIVVDPHYVLDVVEIGRSPRGRRHAR